MNGVLFLVVWTVSVFVHDPCPDMFKFNPYTGENEFAYGCLVNHGHYEEKKMSREFYTRPEAEAFIAAAPEDIRPGMKIEEPK